MFCRIDLKDLVRLFLTKAAENSCEPLMQMMDAQWCSARVKNDVTHVKVWRCTNILTHCSKEPVQAPTLNLVAHLR